MKRTLAGEATILFDRDGLRIDITDALSGLMIMSATLTPDATIRALARTGNVDCTLELWHTGAPIGYVCETKTEVIDLGAAKRDRWTHTRDPGQIRALIAPYCVEGWAPIRGYGSSADWNNQHQRVHALPDGYRVHFNRYVEPHTGAPWRWPERLEEPGDDAS